MESGYESGSSISCEFRSGYGFRCGYDKDPDPIWIQGFDDKKLEKKKSFFDKYCYRYLLMSFLPSCGPGYGSRDPVESGSADTDPNQQHWFFHC
jgi:hypothetical protein